ncbi:MAG: tetratricopeptide repeat protein, partial [Planctomycetota bacterium]
RSLALRQKHERAVWCWRRVLELCHGQRRARAEANIDIPAQTPDEKAVSSTGVSPDTLTTQAYLRIAESLAAIDDHENARRHYLHALARDGRHIEALLGLAELLLDMRRFDAAGQRITRAVRLDPDDPRGHFLAGRRLFAMGRLDEAGVALRRATELDPTLAGAHLLLAKVALRQYDLDEVLRRCRSEMLLRPDDSATLRDLSNLLFEVAEFDDAVACLKRLVAIDPGDSEAWQNLGVAECSRGQLMQGVVASRRALKLDPANLPAANNLALAFLDMGELDAAAKVIREGLSRDPRSRLMRRLRFRLRLCRLRQRVFSAFGRRTRRDD